MSDLLSDANVKKLDVMGTIKDGIEIGVKNIGPILINLLLWVLTCWIPYLNIGTTIGLMVGVVSKASKGELISPTEIFDAQYRKYMGEYFLTCGLMAAGIGFGYLLFIFPGIVIALAWRFAPLLAIDKRKNPIEAIVTSNNITYGNKGRMFGIEILTSLVFIIVSWILMGIGNATYSSGVIGFITFLVFVLWFFWVFVNIGVQASMYRQLAEKV